MNTLIALRQDQTAAAQRTLSTGNREATALSDLEAALRSPPPDELTPWVAVRVWAFEHHDALDSVSTVADLEAADKVDLLRSYRLAVPPASSAVYGYCSMVLTKITQTARAVDHGIDSSQPKIQLGGQLQRFAERQLPRCASALAKTKPGVLFWAALRRSNSDPAAVYSRLEDDLVNATVKALRLFEIPLTPSSELGLFSRPIGQGDISVHLLPCTGSSVISQVVVDGSESLVNGHMGASFLAAITGRTTEDSDCLRLTNRRGDAIEISATRTGLVRGTVTSAGKKRTVDMPFDWPGPGESVQVELWWDFLADASSKAIRLRVGDVEAAPLDDD